MTQGIAPQNPAGAGDMHLIQSMDVRPHLSCPLLSHWVAVQSVMGPLYCMPQDEVIAISFTNTSKVAKGLAENYLLFLSTDLSTKPTAPRTLNITLRDDVLYTMPIEPDAYQGNPTSCGLRWTAARMPLVLAGGGVQLVTYELVKPAGAVDATAEGERQRVQMMGRKPLRIVNGGR